jgi:hypothetical protein
MSFVHPDQLMLAFVAPSASGAEIDKLAVLVNLVAVVFHLN